ncbi:MAG: amidohydrolase family protein [Opitutaceae bacterium]|nr:amidohydrolase family protein [Opitutaceae bacterium]
MRIDCHLHVVGNGTGGTGCWYRPRGVTRFGAPLMLRGVGLPKSALTGDLDGLYAAQMLRFVRESSLDAAVLLAQDDAYQPNGDKIEDVGSFYVPNDFVLGLARQHPEFLAAVSIHPARHDALDELERGLAGGAVLLKCLPNCQNIDWNDPRYTRFLERMAESGLILLAHTGSERTLPVLDRKLADPRVLTRALEIGVTCIAAHCGTGLMVLDPDYFDVFVAMTKKYPRLYGDNSALAGCNFRARPSAIRRMAQDAELQARILHGSDVPVPVTAVLAWLFGLVTWRQWRDTAAIANPIERDAQIKRAMGFGEETFTRLAPLLRGPPRGKVAPAGSPPTVG